MTKEEQARYRQRYPDRAIYHRNRTNARTAAALTVAKRHEAELALEIRAEFERRGLGTPPAALPRGGASPLHPIRKLNADSVMEMRRLRQETGCTYRRLGQMYGVSTSTARDVVLGRTWKEAE